MRHLDLFSGIGGFALAASWVWKNEYENIGHSEIEKFPCKVYHKHFPESECLGDITKIDWTRFKGRVDLVTGGFPCQPFSTASHGRITAIDLFPEMFRAIDEIRPRWVIGENVQRKPIRFASGQLASLGYRTHEICQSADRLGAWHRRNRWFLIAYANDQSQLQGKFNAEMEKLQGVEGNVWRFPDSARGLRISDGVSNRVHRLKALGNAIVPVCAQVIMEAIKQTDEDLQNKSSSKQSKKSSR